MPDSIGKMGLKRLESKKRSEARKEEEVIKEIEQKIYGEPVTFSDRIISLWRFFNNIQEDE